MPAMTVLIGNMGDTVVRVVQEVTDWMARTTVFPEYQEEGAEKEDKKRGEVKNDRASSELDKIRERPSAPGPALVSPEPSLSPGRTLPVRNHADLPSGSSSGVGQAAPSASLVELSPKPQDEEKPAASDPYEQSKGDRGDQNISQVQSDTALLAREICKLAKDVRQQPPKKYGWEEWVNWLNMLGDEGIPDRKLMERDREASMLNQPETSETLVEHLHHDGSHHSHKHHRHHYSSNAQFKRHHGTGKNGKEWHWTWLDDQGPLFSQQTETEWILQRLCNRLEHLMSMGD